MNTALILAAIALFVFQTLSMKLQRAELLAQKLLVNCLACLLAAAGLGIGWLFAPELFAVSLPTLLFGIGFGALFALTILFYNLAISAGPLSYTTFYFSASMLIPAFAGILLFRESFGFPLLGAVALFLAAFYLLNAGGSERQKAQPRWFLYCALTFLCNGLAAVVQKGQQTATGGKEAFGLMLVGFAAAAVCYAAGFLVSRRHQPGAAGAALLRANLPAILLLALGSAGGNVLLTLLAGRVAASYLFPLVQGSIIVGVTLCSVLFFREKLSRQGKLGLLLGLCAILVINL